MKIALVGGIRCEAQPSLRGTCPACGDPMIAKCGEVRIRHWAHKSGSNCDRWWEPETEWHRAWKDKFPADWQEVVHTAGNGEKHIADVKTDHGWVIEFQHSPIKPDERRSRDTFYPKLVWVVDGTRRKTDREKFQNALNKGMPVGRNLRFRRVFSDKCKLLQEWAGSPAPIFFDFGGDVLWWLLYKRPDGAMYVAQFPRTEFIEIHLSQKSDYFAELVKEFSKLASQLRA